MLADEDGAGRCNRLQPAGRVDQVAGHHALVGSADGHGRLAGQDAGASAEPFIQRRHCSHEIKCGADSALRVVLMGRRRTPHGHHGIADELLHAPAVALDDLARQVEVAGQGRTHVLRVAFFGKRREADQVGEQDRHKPPLGLWGGNRLCRGDRRRGGGVGAVGGRGAAG